MLAAFYNRCLRRILCISWEDKVSTEELLKRACSPKLKTLLRRQRLSWVGHVVRMAPERVPRRTSSWQPRSKRSRGRQRQRRNYTVLRVQKPMFQTTDEAMRAASNRKTWRTIVTALCGRPTTAQQ